MGFFQTTDNLSLFFNTLPVVSPKASIVFLHGVGEHIGRYQAAFQVFAHQGYSCFGFDQRGFGQSEGERGHIHSFAEYVADLAGFIAEIVIKDTAKPVFLFGHSMGTIVILAYALRYSSGIRGLMISSCPLKLVHWYANFGGCVADRLSGIAPRLKIPNLINPNELTDDPVVIKALRHDPYIVKCVSANWLHEFKLARENILLNANRILLPTSICHGGEDHIAAVAGAKLLYEKLASADKTLTVFDSLKHELLNHRPSERAQVLKQAFEWLDKHY
ncbi:MAG: lysophospholipase [Methylobacter sp.]|nr:lysophospholipase [Methylobacter sp.]